MAEAEEKLFGTESVVLLEGWMPAEREEELSRVFEDYTCAYETRDPKEEEYPDVPVKLKNNRVTDGLNMVTNMYSLPAYGTVDPNPLMAPFFIVFFGLMFADIGYGILMILAALFALAKIKPQEGSLSFCRLLLWGGIATTIAGFMTGSLFSDAPKQIYDVICASKGIEPTWQGLPRLFSPTEDSILVLVGSLILGWLHLNTGMVVSFVQKWKHGNKADAIWEEGSLWVLLIGAVIFALKKLNVLPWIPNVVAMAALIIGVVMLLFGAGRNAKGFGKVTAAFGCIYNTATGWFGDILSYSRIMALMLAGGVVGQVFNTVAIMPAKNGGINAVTVIAFVVIFLLSLPCALGFNVLAGFEPFGPGSCVLDLEDFLVSNTLLPAGAIFFVVFCNSRYGWGQDKFFDEMNAGAGAKLPRNRFIKIYFKWVLPALIAILLIQGYMSKFAPELAAKIF